MTALLRERREPAKPRPAKPTSIIAHVESSGRGQRVDGEFRGQEMARSGRMDLIPKKKLVLIGRIR